MGLAELVRFGRFLVGLPSYLGSTLSIEGARETVRARLQDRDARFLRLLEQAVVGAPRSPYLALMRQAGCELGDAAAMVRTRGLEATLLALRRAGVYVSFEEFKGRRPIVRGSLVIRSSPADFDNPRLSRCYQAESGGTTGLPTRVSLDLDHYAAQAPLMFLAYRAHGVDGAPRALWQGILPDSTGVGSTLVTAPFRNLPTRWFVPSSSGGGRRLVKGRLATLAYVAAARAGGVAVPWPEPVPMERAITVARWASSTLAERGSCVVSTHVSKALRVCLAAEEEGLDLRGAVFWGGGEPPTPAKVGVIRRAGARQVPSYWFREAGCIGQGCARPADLNDIHLFADAHALIQYPRQVPGASDLSVDAFLFTSLLPTAPKLMLNVESDDYGVVEERHCGCFMGECGLTTHVRDIRSFCKLTGEGVTLVGSEMLRILDEVLPARFGGSPLDYQLHEEEDEQGFTRLTLVVSPRIEGADEARLARAVLESLSADGPGSLTRDVLEQARTLRVRREEPTWTASGKLVPLHLSRGRTGR